MDVFKSPQEKSDGGLPKKPPAQGGIFLLILAAAVLWRLPYLLFWDLFYSSDTAVLGLMARHFLKGEFSAYYWGEGYYGSLDPALLAPLFKIFGATPAVSQWIPFIFSLLFIWIYYRYISRVLDAQSACVSTLILALAPPAFFQITYSVYNYTFILFLGILHLFLFIRFLEGDRRKTYFFLSGLLAGFSWYYFRLILVFWAAIFLNLLMIRVGPASWKKVKEKAAAFRPARVWNDLILLRSAPAPRFLKGFLVFVNLYNCGNFLVACFLWFRGDWTLKFGQFMIKLKLWSIFKSSVLMALFVFAVLHFRKVISLLRSLGANSGSRLLILGFLIGYSPALFGYLIGNSPSSPGGLVALSKIAGNLRLAVPELMSQMAGSSGIFLLKGLSLVLVFSGFTFLLYRFWKQVRGRYANGIEVKPFFAVLALFVTTAFLGIVGTRLVYANMMRYFVPLYICLPLGIALVHKEIGKKSRLLAWSVVVCFLCNSLFASIMIWQKHKSLSPHEQIVQRLSKENIKGGYADYWVAYYVTFLAREKIILVPINGKDRYFPYQKYVQSLEETVLLGETVPPDQKKIKIQGVEYDVLRQDVWENYPVTFLRKSALSPLSFDHR